MNKSTIARVWVAVTALAGVSLLTHAADPGRVATPLERGETVNNVTYSTTDDGATVITFAARDDNFRDRTKTLASATVGVADGAFVGSYEDIAALKLSLHTDGFTPSALKVVLFSGGNRWMTGAVVCVPGEWAQTTLSFDLETEAWDGALAPGADIEAAWQDALASVDAIGIQIRPQQDIAGLSQQVYMIKDFVLVGKDGAEMPGNLSPLGQRLWQRFGVGTLAEVGERGNTVNAITGHTALEEAILGLSENDPNGFRAVVLERTSEGVRIQWNSAVDGNTYNVYRTTSLAEGFGPAPVAELTVTSAGVSVQSGASVWMDNTVEDPRGGPYFYKVIAVATEGGN